MSESNAVMALKNAWNGSVATAAELEKLAPTVAGLADATPLEALDLELYSKLTLANAIAASALRGLIEEIQRKRQEGKQV